MPLGESDGKWKCGLAIGAVDRMLGHASEEDCAALGEGLWPAKWFLSA